MRRVRDEEGERWGRERWGGKEMRRVRDEDSEGWARER